MHRAVSLHQHGSRYILLRRAEYTLLYDKMFVYMHVVSLMVAWR